MCDLEVIGDSIYVQVNTQCCNLGEDESNLLLKLQKKTFSFPMSLSKQKEYKLTVKVNRGSSNTRHKGNRVRAWDDYYDYSQHGNVIFSGLSMILCQPGDVMTH